MMKGRLSSCWLALGLLVASAASAPAQPYDTGAIPDPVILMPDAPPTAMVILLSDAGGWSLEDKTEAERLQGNGAIVVGIDTPHYLAALAKDDGHCVYTISDLESLSHQIQRAAGNSSYLPPIIGGIGEGGALALAMLAQTPKETIGQTLAVDPQAGIPLAREFCTPATKTLTGNSTVYGLPDGDLPDLLTVVFSSAASAEGRAHVADLAAAHDDIDIRDTDGKPAAILSATLDDLMAASGSEQPLGLPLAVLDATPSHDTMAVVYSGDGGWRDLDREVAGNLQQAGIPVIGVDSLRYFWSKRTPQETADDLSRIIRTYAKRWKTHHVLLVGYSFGADILPATYNLLPDHQKQKVAQVTLLALSHQVDYEISVTGWLGVKGDGEGGDPLNDIKRIPTDLVQCFYGKDEENDACRDLAGTGVDANELDGGHHFDGDYESLTRSIVQRLLSRLNG